MKDNSYLNILWILFLLTCIGSCFGNQGVAEYCEDEMFVAECQHGEAILIESALYGRMQVGRCVNKNYGNIGCAIDVRAHLDQWCSGRRSCEVPVTNLLRGSTKPCPKDFRSYLEASYSCLPIISVDAASCQHTSFVRVDSTEGYIASSVTGKTGCGTIDTPWYIEAQPGQRINISLWDFDVINQVTSSRGPGGLPTPCHVYAIIKEKDYTSSKTVCPDGSRISHVMMSQGNQVEIRIVTKRQDETPDEEGQFLLHFNVVGCADIEATGDAFFNRKGHSSGTYGCKSTGERWQLTCVNNKWKGNYEKCSAAGGGTDSDNGWNIATSSHGMSIAIIIAVAVLVGILILIAGLICLKWRRQKYAEARKQLNEAMHSPQDPRHYGYAGSQIVKSYDPYGSTGENNYYRTWQMQRHGMTKDGRDLPIPPPPYLHNTVAGVAGGSDVMNPRYVEHIYESPKFERRQFSDEPNNSGGCGILEFNPTQQYFELDPDVVSSKPGEPSTSSSRNAQFSPRNFSAPRL